MKCPTPISIKDPRGQKASTRINVPCGKCGACRHNRRSDWTFRLKQELKVAKSCFFLTLTYEDCNLPTTEHGEVTLCKKDFQLFMKRLRKENLKNNDLPLRYYAVGEYGTKTNRPHYHAILFNLHPKTLFKLDQIWLHGYTQADPINDARIHYVTKYHVNATKGKDDIENEFALMSRNPGIGSNYIDKNKNMHRNALQFHVTNDGYIQNMPRYYLEKTFLPHELEKRAQQLSDKTYDDYYREYNRLHNLGYDDPDHEMFKREIASAKRIKDKAQQKGTL